MKIGISAFAWTASFGSSHLSLVEKACEYGFAALEVPMFRPADLPIKALRARFEASGLECTVCAILPPGVNPISSDKETRRLSLIHLADCIHAAADMGGHLLGGPLLAPIGYLPGHRPTEDEWAWAIEACQSVRSLLHTYDMNLSLEPVNRSETFFLRTARDVKRLCSSVADPRIGATIDTFHANIEESNIPEAIQRLGPDLKHVHIRENDRGFLGRGHVDFRAIWGSLRNVEYQGLLVIEGFGFDPAEPHSPGYLWADQAVSPGTMALSGLEYLRSLAKESSL